MKRAAFTIDVDSIRHYYDIHGLPQPTSATDPIYTIAMPRFWELIKEFGIPATLFLIGKDAPEYAEYFSPVAETHSEIASHSFAHDYRLCEQSSESILEDLTQADQVLVPLNGHRPISGFRAPGYNINAKLLTAVQQLGYTYDSSVLPSPLYFAARWSIIQFYKLRGRQSRSLPGQMKQFARGLKPYRFHPSEPFKPNSSGALMELPMACSPLARVPLIGTSLAVLPSKVQSAVLSYATRSLPFFNFEMHAIDLLDESDHPCLKELAQLQPDLRISFRQKQRNLRHLLGKLCASFRVETLNNIVQNSTTFENKV
ncbi:MAG: polysaccharide deacetylase family protein [Myxococcota bacterium]|nr:polysaccharide deacetylase family protein [Myxococcota bacterium]